MSEQGERLVTPWTVCKFFQGNPDAVKYGDDPSLKVTNFIQWYDEGDWVSGLVPRLRHKDFHKVEDVIEAICSCGRNQCFHMAAMLLHVQNKKLVQESELMTRLTEDVFYLTNKEMPDHKFGADIVYQGRVSNGSQYLPAVIAFYTCPNEIQQKINMLVTLDNKQDQRGVLLKFPKILGDVQFDSEQGKFVAIEDTGSCSLLKYINLPEEEKKVKGNCSRFFKQLVSTMKFIHSEKCYLKYFDPDSISVSSDEQRIEIDAFASVARCDPDQELVQAQSDNVYALGGLIDFIVRKGASEFSFSNLNQNKTRIWDVSEFKTQALGEWMQPVSQMLDADNRRPRLFDLLFPTCDQELKETLVTQKEDYVTPLPEVEETLVVQKKDSVLLLSEEETLEEILEETLVVQRNDHGFLVSEKKKALTLQTEDYLASLPETSLLIELPPISTYKGLFRYCAISMSSGREVSKYDKNTTTVLDGIQPGDKYEVLVYEVKEKTERLIAKSIKQTKKFIGKDGGIVEVGCCILDFPEGAIKDETFIEIDRSHKNFPRLPENTISIAPIMDFRSTQSVFLKPVSCKITTPYVTSPTPVKLEIICYENGRWDHVCYGELDGDSKVVEFKCDHFTPYAEIIPKPFTEIRHMDIQFDIRNRIYIDEHNIACVTYLDHKPIVENFEPELSAYQLSAFVLRKSFLRVGEHFDFCLKSVMPDREFGNWRVTLDEEFVRNDWSSTEVFPIDRDNFPTPVVLSQFMRRHSDYTQPEYTARARLDFEKQLGGACDTMASPQQSNTASNLQEKMDIQESETADERMISSHRQGQKRSHLPSVPGNNKKPSGRKRPIITPVANVVTRRTGNMIVSEQRTAAWVEPNHRHWLHNQGQLPEFAVPQLPPEQSVLEQQGKKELAKGQAQMYAGEQRMIGGSRPLAVKIIKYTPKKEREVKNLLKLTPHVNVVSIIDAREIPNRIPKSLFVAMEQCQSMSLEEYYEKRKKDKLPFNVKQALEFARQIIEGINHIHKNNIIHRDLKPSSVLFSLDGKNLKIIDFGVSKELEQGLSTMSISTGNIGTDGFRAPETYQRDEMKRLADIFSLGIVLYHIWSYGCHPFGEDSTIWSYNIKSGNDPDLSRLLVPNRKKAEELLLRMLKKVHRERLQITDIILHEYIKQGVPETMQSDMEEAFRGHIQVNDQTLRSIDCIVYQRAGQPGLKLEGQTLRLSLTCVPSGGLMKEVVKNIQGLIPDGHLAISKTNGSKLLKKLKGNKMGWTNLFRNGNRLGAILIFHPRGYEELFGVYVEKPEEWIGGMTDFLLSTETKSKHMAKEPCEPELAKQRAEDFDHVLTEQIDDTRNGDDSHETMEVSNSTSQQTEIGNPGGKTDVAPA